MKQIGRTAGLVAGGVVLLALAAGAGFAAPPSRSHGPGPMGMAGDPGFMVGHIMSQLDLDESQRQAIHERLQGSMEGMAGVAERMRTARQALAETIHARDLDEAAIRAAATEVGVVEGDLAVARAEMLRQVREVLTPEQQEKMEQIMAEHLAEMLEHGPMPGRQQGAGAGPGHRHGDNAAGGL